MGKRRTAIHGKERNGDVESNFGTAKHDTSIKASRSEQRKPRSRHDARTITTAHPRKLHIIKSQILNSTYEPQPVRRAEIPKPDGGVRLLGIPTVTDRLIQQAISQILSKEYDSTFSDHSYGFRPNRSAP